MTESQTPVRKTPGWASAGLSDLTVASNPGASLLADRTGWTRVRFGDVVQNLNETQRDPGSAGIERYVGLECLDPGSLHIRSWGRVADGTTFTRRCRPGQTLFGKRRAYQRKVAVAEFDAVVSGDIYVFQSRPDQLLSELLPFICLSERFYQFAVETSAGSLSPRTNWNHLSEFELALPPLDQQRRIADLLWAVDVAWQQCRAAEYAATKQRASVVSGFVSEHAGRLVPLGEHLSGVQYGTSSRASSVETRTGIPVLRIPNVISGRVDYGDVAWLDDAGEFHRFLLTEGDVLVVRTNGNPNYVGRSAVYHCDRFEDCAFASYLIRLKCVEATLAPEFLHEMLESAHIRGQIRKQVKSSAGNYNLNTEGIRGLSLPIPGRKEQIGLLEGLLKLDAVIAALEADRASLGRLSSVLLSEVMP